MQPGGKLSHDEGSPQGCRNNQGTPTSRSVRPSRLREVFELEGFRPTLLDRMTRREHVIATGTLMRRVFCDAACSVLFALSQ